MKTPNPPRSGGSGPGCPPGGQPGGRALGEAVYAGPRRQRLLPADVYEAGERTAGAAGIAGRKPKAAAPVHGKCCAFASRVNLPPGPGHGCGPTPQATPRAQHLLSPARRSLEVRMHLDPVPASRRPSRDGAQWTDEIKKPSPQSVLSRRHSLGRGPCCLQPRLNRIDALQRRTNRRETQREPLVFANEFAGTGVASRGRCREARC